MVRILCLDEDESDDADLVNLLHRAPLANEQASLNNRHGFSTALRCYP